MARKNGGSCPRCEVGDHERNRRPDGLKHRATTKPPSVRTMERWMADCGAEATDGCWVEPDGTCEHGHSSWMRLMGVV